jgi:adenosylhomocysteine nucleosidase
MSKIAIVAALEREVRTLTKGWSRVEREHQGRSFIFFEQDETVLVCGGIGVEAARRAAEAVIALYRPMLVQSVGFAGALNPDLHVGDLFTPAVVIDARDGSRIEIEGGDPRTTLVTFMAVAGVDQKTNLAQAYGAQAVDMEASAVGAAARAHGQGFSATKVISDDLKFAMPQIDRFIDARGGFRTASFAFFVALRPWLWARVVTLASNSRKAERALSEHLKHENLKRFHPEPSQSSSQPSERPITASTGSRSAAVTTTGGRK